MNPTPKQLAILRHIADVQDRSGYSPTLAEIGDTFKINKVTVFEHTTALIQKGFLRRAARKSRSLVLTDDAMRIVRPNRATTCPHCGKHLTAS